MTEVTLATCKGLSVIVPVPFPTVTVYVSAPSCSLSSSPGNLTSNLLTPAGTVRDREQRDGRVTARMIQQQEELDWSEREKTASGKSDSADGTATGETSMGTNGWC